MSYRGEYPEDWPALALAVKVAAGWRCVRCGHPHAPRARRTLTVHHLDNDKSNVVWWNLVALCQRCHLSIQGRVRLGQTYSLPHTPWFRVYAAGYYAAAAGLAVSRAEVESDLPHYLALGQPHLADYYRTQP